MKKLLIVTGELSAFNYAREIVNELKNEIELYGVLLENLEGVKNIYDAKRLTAFGLFEAISKLPEIRKGLKTIKNFLKKEKPDAVLLIDFPGFNMRVTEIAKKEGIKVFYFISPKFWAWNYKRGKKIAKLVDKMFVIFPFEVKLYRKFGLEAIYVGNPLVDMVKPAIPETIFFKNYNLTKKPILLMPGSRESEIKYLLETILETAVKIKISKPEEEFILPVAESLDFELISRKTKKIAPFVKIVKGSEVYNAMFYSKSGIIASGTASLEAAIALLPHVVIYKLHPLTFTIAKRLVKTKYISLPNIIAEEKIVPELIQKDATPRKIKETLMEIEINNEQIKNDLSEKVKEKLKGNAIKTLCEEVKASL
ncbi:lipid-A-disaccharide synthase [Desulfurobacterium indicum]|uniref:Lipid-A-disaccharide synthase n=1 Tax=Desulfurobacterium indicum TaxID=1914305 RepID=A0A1R1MK91_9BACT|nr:lipid-A-disaccharide synthase [Desulfurobacterium indicum]OMH40120.1 lipid-A-disaccharide synthase [Desulfurobacterium indicum]